MGSSISIKMKYWAKVIAAVVEYKNEKLDFWFQVFIMSTGDRSCNSNMC